MKINNASAASASINNHIMKAPRSPRGGLSIVGLGAALLALGLSACTAPPAVRDGVPGAANGHAARPADGTASGTASESASGSPSSGASSGPAPAISGAANAGGAAVPSGAPNAATGATPPSTARADDLRAAAPIAIPAALTPVPFKELEGWADDDIAQAWPAFLAGCTTLRNRAEWRAVCTDALRVDAKSRWAMRKFFVERFQPYRVRSGDPQSQGLLTGYYEPLMRASRQRQGEFQVPIYGPPDDLITLDLASFVPDAQTNQRLRGRVVTSTEGKRSFVPYYSRAELTDGAGAASLAGKELAWVADPVEAFFLQVQGSGRVQFDDGSWARLGYADTNGHPYRSIGRWLIERGELKAEDASMQSIQAWARAHPERVGELLAQNPSFVFFRETPTTDHGPLGSLGIALTAERSIAVDPRHIPMGAPVWMASTLPMSSQPLRRLVFAQDTGGAIVGPVRADLYWGSGERAGELAGRTKQRLDLWVLLPKR